MARISPVVDGARIRIRPLPSAFSRVSGYSVDREYDGVPVYGRNFRILLLYAFSPYVDDPILSAVRSSEDMVILLSMPLFPSTEL
jgi:hypothetical protein